MCDVGCRLLFLLYCNPTAAGVTIPGCWLSCTLLERQVYTWDKALSERGLGPWLKSLYYSVGWTLVHLICLVTHFHSSLDPVCHISTVIILVLSGMFLKFPLVFWEGFHSNYVTVYSCFPANVLPCPAVFVVKVRWACLLFRLQFSRTAQQYLIAD